MKDHFEEDEQEKYAKYPVTDVSLPMTKHLIFDYSMMFLIIRLFVTLTRERRKQTDK